MNGKLIQKIYLLKNAKKTCELNNRDLHRSWIIFMTVIVTFLLPCSIIGGAWNYMRKKGEIDKSLFKIFRVFFFFSRKVWLLIFVAEKILSQNREITISKRVIVFIEIG